MLRYLTSQLPRGLILALAMLGGCTAPEPVAEDTTKAVGPPPPPPPAPLRVGITPNYPPMIFKQRGRTLGAEADFARQLARELGRPLEFVELTWERQIPALLSGKTDIIMSGMTITDARRVRIAFADPYFRSGLFTMMRAEDQALYDSPERVLSADATVGVVRGTTGQVFVEQHMPQARKWLISAPADAPFELTRYKIDLFVYDGPAITWISSESEAGVTALFEPLNSEYLGWGLRRGDAKLQTQVNEILARWKQNGTLSTVLRQWLPYLWEPERGPGDGL